MPFPLSGVSETFKVTVSIRLFRKLHRPTLRCREGRALLQKKPVYPTLTITSPKRETSAVWAALNQGVHQTCFPD
ncbi:unnamed protein product, partial [Staurois parvus]